MPVPVTDIVFSGDLSASFSGDLDNYKTQIPIAVNRLINPNLATILGNDVNFGVTSFIDKPVGSFGGSSDYVYQRELTLTNDISAVKTTVNKLFTRNGADSREAQLDALAHTTLDSTLGWRTGSSKIAIIATDAAYHQAGDGLGIGPITRVNDADEFVEADEDYWSVSQVKTVIEDHNVIPVFLVTDNVKSHYDNLVTTLGRGFVLDLDDNSENISDAIKYGVALANGSITTQGTAGDDSLYPMGAGDQVVFTGGGNDTVLMAFASGNHYIDGGAGYDVLYGGIGQDTIDAGTSNDVLNGGNGNDILFGSSGDDNLTGGGGNDYLQGDSGNDFLTGGFGEDRFGFATGTSFDINDLGVDTIQDFSTSEGDKIQLSKFTFDSLSSSVGTLGSADFGAVASGKPITYDSSNGDLFYQGTLFAEFSGNPSLSASDFEVVDF